MWLLVPALMTLPACAGQLARKRPPNVVLVTIDTLRWDHTTPAGYLRDTTPTLARLASEAVVFDTAYTPTSTTGPAHATIFSGLLPSLHGLRRNGESLPPEVPVLADFLANKGWRTSAVVSSFVLNHRFGWRRGFATFDDRFDPDHASVKTDIWTGFEVQGGVLDQRADAATAKAIEAVDELAREDASPFFLWVHYFDPHSPYDPPPAYEAAFQGSEQPAGELAELERRYDAEILFTDAELGKLIDFLQAKGLLDSTLLIITSDHGEAFMEHGYLYHGIGLWEEFVRVPLVIRLPGGRTGDRRVQAPVGLIDLVPTVVDLLGLEWEHPVDGVSLRAFLKNPESVDPAAPPRPLFLERQTYPTAATCRYNLPPWFTTGLDAPVETPALGVVYGGWKLLETPESGLRELFDLAADPGERHNLAPRRPGMADQLAAMVEDKERARPQAARPTQVLSDEDRERLRSLGYID